jgi:hypothetical protein
MPHYDIVDLSLSRIEYNKKRDKKASVKFMKDETVPRNDMYKSHTVHVPSGEPAGSVSRPMPKKKPGSSRPKPGGSSVCCSNISWDNR